MTRTFRPTLKYWLKNIGSLIGWLGLAVAMLIIPAVYPIPDMWLEIVDMIFVGALFLAILSIYAIFRSLWLVILIDGRRLKCAYGFNKSFEFEWTDVLASWVAFDERNNKNLFFSTLDGVSTIESTTFDIESIWREVETHIDPEALQEDASEKAAVIIWENLQRELEGRVAQRPLSITTNKSIKVLGWISLLIWAVPSTLSLMNGNFLSASFFIGFALLSVALILMSSKIEIDAESIVSIKWHGQYSIRWDQIETIMIDDRQHAYLVFKGNGKQLAIAGPSGWSGSDKENMVYWLNRQLEEHSVETEKARFISFKRSKNTRVRK